MTEKLSTEEIAEKTKIFDENFKDIKERVAAAAERSGRSPQDIILLAATKTVPVEVVNHAIEKGLSYIGENRVQEFLSKEAALLPVHRHLIGHLQTNKVRDIVGRVEMIESVDSLKLAREISKQSEKRGKQIGRRTRNFGRNCGRNRQITVCKDPRTHGNSAHLLRERTNSQIF